MKKAFSFTRLGVVIAVLVALLGIAYALFFAYAASTNQFPIQTVKVMGSYQYAKDEDIQKTLLPFVTNTGLYAFDELNAEKALEALPGIQYASIWRMPPHQVRVILREKPAIARLTDGTLLAQDSSRFTVPAEADTTNLPVIVGDPRYLKSMLLMIESLKPVFDYDALTVSGLGLGTNGDWSVQLNHQFWLIMGKDQLPERVANFLNVYPILLQNAPNPGQTPLRIDLRYTGGMAVLWKSAS